jgi:hypothetical protein
MRIVSIITFIALLIPVSAIAGDISPVSYGFYQITDKPGDLSSQLFMEVSSTDNGSKVHFKFTNDAVINSTIAGIFFDDNNEFFEIDLVHYTEPMIIESDGNNNNSVAFQFDSNPNTLPGGNGNPIKFGATFSTSKDGSNSLGIDAKDEWVEIIFTLINGHDAKDVIDALNSGDIRVGLHVTSIGGKDCDLSESYLNQKTPTSVPEPSFVLLLGIGLCAMVVLSRRFNRS